MTTFSFKTIGCRLNQAETALMRGTIAAQGGKIVKFGEPCDLCVIHGCVITKRAEKNTLRLVRAAKKAGFAKQIALAGCPVEILSCHETGADICLDQAAKMNIALWHPGLKKDMPQKQPVPLFDSTRAVIRIQSGCNFYCSYCIVPYARQKLYSRPLPEIIAEIQALTSAGYQEIVITGANLGTYAWQEKRLIDVLQTIEKQTAVKRLRLSSIELSTTERDVIDHIADSAVVCPFLHLPLQSGSNSVLQNMRRRYTRQDYIATLEYALKKLNQPGLGTDVLVGFPGETEADFADTCDLIENRPFNNIHVFAYSRRPGTDAATMPGQIPATVKKERLDHLLQLAVKKRIEFANQWLGKTVEVLIEQIPSKTKLATGLTREYLPAHISLPDNPDLRPNTIVKATVKSLDGCTLLLSQPQIAQMSRKSRAE